MEELQDQLSNTYISLSVLLDIVWEQGQAPEKTINIFLAALDEIKNLQDQQNRSK
jgi:hypothetical protein